MKKFGAFVLSFPPIRFPQESFQHLAQGVPGKIFGPELNAGEPLVLGQLGVDPLFDLFFGQHGTG